MNDTAACGALRATIDITRRALAAGNLIDLAGFEHEVAELCASIAHDPAAASPTVAVELTALLGELESLAGEMAKQTARLRPDEIDAARRRSARAYRPASGKTQREEI
jgi:hypothetical protein